jgi:hypothetical protein
MSDRKFSHEERKAIEGGVQALAQRCDSARSRDGVGFNKFDADFGQDLAQSVEEYGSLSDNQLAAAFKMLQKYRGQLEDMGIHLPRDEEGMLDSASEIRSKLIQASNALDSGDIEGVESLISQCIQKSSALTESLRGDE